MNGIHSPQITVAHRGRLAIVYMRQSTQRQVDQNTGSTAHQRYQAEYARQWGWPESAIEIIDEDLGLSGTSVTDRMGWQRLLRMVTQNLVGIIFVSDISRLNRSSTDFHVLAELCRVMGVLLVVDGRIVDFDDPTDRFMADIESSVAQYQNAIRTRTFQTAALAKARAGHAVRRPPTGYEEYPKGQWVKDRDQAVREAIERLFRDFQRLGTIGQVLRYYRKHGLKLPVRLQGELRWVKPARARIYWMLVNPAYAGTYVYGKYITVNGKLRRQPSPEAVIVVPGHHEPYIAMEDWEQIQSRLHQNRPTMRQAAGIGPGLCQGIVRCGRCNRKMRIRYHKGKDGRESYTYYCEEAYLQYGEEKCWTVYGPSVDEVVYRMVLESLQPPELEAVVAATTDANGAYEAVVRQGEAALAQAQYQVDLARRRYELVDPANRRVALALEQDLEQRLQELDALRRRQAESRPVRPITPSPEVLAAIQQLARDLPALWAAPSTTHQDRKTLLRLFVQEVRLVAKNDITFDIEIQWVGGPVSRHTLFQPWGPARLVLQLKGEGLSKEQIAEELSRRGAKTMHGRRPYTLKHVQTYLTRARRRHPDEADPPWTRRREEYRPLIEQWISEGLNDSTMAAELNRRNLPACTPGKPWTRPMVGSLRRALKIPVEASIDRRREEVQILVAELARMLPDDRAIAEELTRRGIPALRSGPWTADKVRHIRKYYGIPPSMEDAG